MYVRYQSCAQHRVMYNLLATLLYQPAVEHTEYCHDIIFMQTVFLCSSIPSIAVYALAPPLIGPTTSIVHRALSLPTLVTQPLRQRTISSQKYRNNKPRPLAKSSRHLARFLGVIKAPMPAPVWTNHTDSAIDSYSLRFTATRF
jgi:hypothetical protein